MWLQNFTAKNEKQLGLCLKLLYLEKIKSQVELQLTEKDKVIYLIWVRVNDETWSKLDSMYKILIG